MKVEVLGGAGVIANIAAVRAQALEITDTELSNAALFGSDFTRAIAPIDTGAYRHGGVSRSGTPVENGIVSAKTGDLEYAWGSPAPYGRVLELGFGPKPPRPHFEPSKRVVADFFIQSMIQRGFQR